MKKKILKRIITLCVLMLVLPTSAKADLSDDLVAYYPFSGNANDETGNGNNGLVNGATLVSDMRGNPNSAYELEPYGQSGDTITLYSPGNRYDFTINFWGQSTHNNYIIDTANRGDGNFIFSNGQYVSKWDENIGTYEGGNLGINDGSGFHDIGVFCDDESWHMFTIAYDSDIGKVYIYFDDTLVLIKTLSSDFHIGSNLVFESGRNNQVLDEVRIYSRKLGSSEIRDLYESYILPTYSSGLLYVPSVNAGSLGIYDNVEVTIDRVINAVPRD